MAPGPSTLDSPTGLDRPLSRLAQLMDADAVMLARRRRDGCGLVRIAGNGTLRNILSNVSSTAAQLIDAGRVGVDTIAADGHEIVHWLDCPRGCNLALVVVRSPERFPFSAEDLRVLAASAGWVEDVVELWWSRQRQAARTAGLRTALGMGGGGAILLDSSGEILEADGAATGILEASDGLMRSGNRLSAEHEADAARLRDAVLGVVIAAAAGKTAPPVQFIVRRSQRRPLAVAVMRPLQMPDVQSDRHDPAVLVMVVDPEPEHLTASAACVLLELTPAETRLAEQLAAGKTVAEAAAATGVQVQTARTYLKHIFAKTGVNRQATLVSLLLNTRLPLRRVDSGEVPGQRLRPGRRPRGATPTLAMPRGATALRFGPMTPPARDDAPATLACQREAEEPIVREVAAVEPPRHRNGATYAGPARGANKRAWSQSAASLS